MEQTPMSLIIATLLSAAVQVGTGNAQVSNLPGVFEATCLDGQARLSANDVSQITFDQLPPALQESLGRPASGKVWQLNTAGHAYLYVLDYDVRPGVSPKVCGLASDTMDFRSASDKLEMRVAGSVDRNRVQSAQWLNPKDGYVATATNAAQFKVLQINWLNDADRAAATQQVEGLAR